MPISSEIQQDKKELEKSISSLIKDFEQKYPYVVITGTGFVRAAIHHGSDKEVLLGTALVIELR
jgi:hypothetical protein